MVVGYPYPISSIELCLSDGTSTERVKCVHLALRKQ